jgi:hypothetical protein
MLANMPAGLLSQGMGHTPGMVVGALLLAFAALITAAASGMRFAHTAACARSLTRTRTHTRTTQCAWLICAPVSVPPAAPRCDAGYHGLLLGSLLTGGGEACFNISTQAHVRNAVGAHMHGRTLSVLAAIPRWATVFSPVLGSALVTWIGWPAPFVALAALAATAGAVVAASPVSARGCAAPRASGGGGGGGGGGGPLTRKGSTASLVAGAARLHATAAAHWRALATGGVVRDGARHASSCAHAALPFCARSNACAHASPLFLFFRPGSGGRLLERAPRRARALHSAARRGRGHERGAGRMGRCETQKHTRVIIRVCVACIACPPLLLTPRPFAFLLPQ